MTAALARHSHQSGPSEERFANVYEAEAIAAIAVRGPLKVF